MLLRPAMCQELLHGGPKGSVGESVKVKSRFHWSSQDVEMPVLQDSCQRELLTGCGNSPREKGELQQNWGSEEPFDTNHVDAVWS